MAQHYTNQSLLGQGPTYATHKKSATKPEVMMRKTKVKLKLDLDNTLTRTKGALTIISAFYKSLNLGKQSHAELVQAFVKHFGPYQGTDPLKNGQPHPDANLLLSPEALDYLKSALAAYPVVKVQIITKNAPKYALALLAYQGVPIKNITVAHGDKTLHARYDLSSMGLQCVHMEAADLPEDKPFNPMNLIDDIQEGNPPRRYFLTKQGFLHYWVHPGKTTTVVKQLTDQQMSELLPEKSTFPRFREEDDISFSFADTITSNLSKEQVAIIGEHALQRVDDNLELIIGFDDDPEDFQALREGCTVDGNKRPLTRANVIVKQKIAWAVFHTPIDPTKVVKDTFSKMVCSDNTILIHDGKIYLYFFKPERIEPVIKTNSNKTKYNALIARTTQNTHQSATTAEIRFIAEELQILFDEDQTFFESEWATEKQKLAPYLSQSVNRIPKGHDGKPSPLIQILIDWDGTSTRANGGLTKGSALYLALKAVRGDNNAEDSIINAHFGGLPPTKNLQDIDLLLSTDAIEFYKNALAQYPDVKITIVTGSNVHYIKTILRYQGFTAEEIEKITIKEAENYKAGYTADALQVCGLHRVNLDKSQVDQLDSLKQLKDDDGDLFSDRLNALPYNYILTTDNHLYYWDSESQTPTYCGELTQDDVAVLKNTYASNDDPFATLKHTTNGTKTGTPPTAVLDILGKYDERNLTRLMFTYAYDDSKLQMTQLVKGAEISALYGDVAIVAKQKMALVLMRGKLNSSVQFLEDDRYTDSAIAIDEDENGKAIIYYLKKPDPYKTELTVTKIEKTEQNKEMYDRLVSKPTLMYQPATEAEIKFVLQEAGQPITEDMLFDRDWGKEWQHIEASLALVRGHDVKLDGSKSAAANHVKKTSFISNLIAGFPVPRNWADLPLYLINLPIQIVLLTVELIMGGFASLFKMPWNGMRQLADHFKVGTVGSVILMGIVSPFYLASLVLFMPSNLARYARNMVDGLCNLGARTLAYLTGETAKYPSYQTLGAYTLKQFARLGGLGIQPLTDRIDTWLTPKHNEVKPDPSSASEKPPVLDPSPIPKPNDDIGKDNACYVDLLGTHPRKSSQSDIVENITRDDNQNRLG